MDCSNRSNRSSSIFEDCPICLDEMHATDHEHMLQCDRHCGYNFCQSCIESLISSSKDDYMEASDGNRHVKIFLLCPNCRSDLSTTIRDTLLLRKADSIKAAAVGGRQDEMTASQLRLQKVLGQEQVQNAILQARQAEAAYLGRELVIEESEQEESEESEGDDSYDEEGVEMDLIQGVHKSFRMPKAPMPKELLKLDVIVVDPTLFAGLDYFLTEAEREFVTELMTAGDVNKLSEAAHILYFVAQKSKDPSAFKKKKESPAHRKSRRLTRRSSVFELINEAQQVKVKKGKIAGDADAFYNSDRDKVAEHRRLNSELQKSAQFQKHFPVPVRMPKCIEVNLTDGPFALQFVDHEWDGTVRDAYSKISIGFTGSIEQKKSYHNVGVRTVLGYENDDTDVRIELPNQPRVLLKHVNQHAAQQGAIKGDVVTHVGDKDLAGKSVAELLVRINAIKQQGHKTVFLTLNAERSVAEALKRRAMAIAEAS